MQLLTMQQSTPSKDMLSQPPITAINTPRITLDKDTNEQLNTQSIRKSTIRGESREKRTPPQKEKETKKFKLQ